MTQINSDDFPIRVKKLRENAQLPRRSTSFAAGADIFAEDACEIAPGERFLVPTGLAVEIPVGFYGRVAPRSGLAVKNGIDVMAGVIDSDYRGELKILVINLGREVIKFAAGDRVAQLIIERAAPAVYSWADELDETVRAEGGFGSTGT